MSDNQPIIYLSTADKSCKIKVSSKCASISGYITKSIKSDPPTYNIKVDTDEDTLNLVVKYMLQKKGKSELTVSRHIIRDFSEGCNDEWDVDFISELTNQQLISLVNVADFLDIEHLLHLTAARMASKQAGKSATKIDEFYLGKKIEEIDNID